MSPPEWLDQLKQQDPSEPHAPADFVRPTAQYERQGRVKQLRNAWTFLYGQKDKVRKELLYFHATSGGGKTALLKFMLERNPADITEAIQPWAESATMLAVSFNGITPLTEFDQAALEQRYWLVPVATRLLFAEQSALDFDTFCNRLQHACDEGILRLGDLDLLENVLTDLGKLSKDGNTILLFDEILKIEEQSTSVTLDQVRRRMCVSMDTAKFQVVFTTLSNHAMAREHTSSRDLERIGLPVLTFGETLSIIKNNTNDLQLFRGLLDVGDEVRAALARLSGGHPRTVEVLVDRCHSFSSNNIDLKNVVSKAISHMIERYQEKLKVYPWPLMKAVLAGVPVILSDKPDPADNRTYDDYVEAGYLTSVDSDDGKHLQVSEAMLRFFVRSHSGITDGDTSAVLQKVEYLLNNTDNFSGKLFEKFHMRWEEIRRSCTGSFPNVFSAILLKSYYGCECTKGPLSDTYVSMTAPLLGSMPFLRGEVKVGGSTWNEIPPHKHIPEEDLLCYVWYASEATFPGLDFILFVRTVAIPGKPSRIIALVFQSKYSDSHSSTTLGTSETDTSHRHVETVMNQAGWGEDDYVLIFHPYRRVAGTVSANLPAKNCMLLTKDELMRLYSSLDYTLQYDMMRHANR